MFGSRSTVSISEAIERFSFFFFFRFSEDPTKGDLPSIRLNSQDSFGNTPLSHYVCMCVRIRHLQKGKSLALQRNRRSAVTFRMMNFHGTEAVIVMQAYDR